MRTCKVHTSARMCTRVRVCIHSHVRMGARACALECVCEGVEREPDRPTIMMDQSFTGGFQCIGRVVTGRLLSVMLLLLLLSCIFLHTDSEAQSIALYIFAIL